MITLNMNSTVTYLIHAKIIIDMEDTNHHNSTARDTKLESYPHQILEWYFIFLSIPLATNDHDNFLWNHQ